MDKLTTLSPMPKEKKERINRYYECNLLHEKVPVYHEGKIYHLCPICDRKKENEK